MKSSVLSFVVAVAVFAAIGAFAERIASPVSQAMRAREPALRQTPASAGTGQGVMLALLGGSRALVADALWVRLHARWEVRDLDGAEALVRRVPTIDPRPIYFWQNGARMIAYDFPAWRIAAAGGHATVSADEQQRIVREQARSALGFLETALALHGECAELWVERANIEYGRLPDLDAAAESYRRAAEQKNAPAYAARLHAEMLRRLGRKSEALAWLTRLHPTLPSDDEAAAADLVLARIRDLERELGVAAEKVYRAAEPQPRRISISSQSAQRSSRRSQRMYLPR